MIYEVNVRDHPRKKIAECWQWGKTHCQGRWDITVTTKERKYRLNPDRKSDDEPVTVTYDPDDAEFLRPADADRSFDIGGYMDLQTERGGHRDLSVLKQFVKIRMAFADPEEAKAFRRWLRSDDG